MESIHCKLSIIVPVFGVEKYVGKALDSIFTSKASDTAYEVIVVNDGTKDRSMDVIRQFDNRANLTIIEQENQGLGAARMKGLSAAGGEYVWFVDSDDWLVNDGVGVVLNLLADRPDAEVLMFPLRWVYEDPSKADRMDYSLKQEVVANGRKLVWDMELEVVGSPRFVIRRSLFSNPWLYFPQGVLFEDVYFGGVLASIAKVFHVLPFPVYNYRIRSGSIMRALNIRSSYDMVSVHKMVMVFKEHVVEASDWEWFDYYFFRHLMYAYERMRQYYHTPEFKLFSLTRGFYVWTQWKKVYPQETWKTKLKYLKKFMLPE